MLPRVAAQLLRRLPAAAAPRHSAHAAAAAAAAAAEARPARPRVVVLGAGWAAFAFLRALDRRVFDSLLTQQDATGCFA